MRKLVGVLAMSAAGAVGAFTLAPTAAQATVAPVLETCGCDHLGQWLPGGVLDPGFGPDDKGRGAAVAYGGRGGAASADGYGQGGGRGNTKGTGGSGHGNGGKDHGTGGSGHGNGGGTGTGGGRGHD